MGVRVLVGREVAGEVGVGVMEVKVKVAGRHATILAVGLEVPVGATIGWAVGLGVGDAVTIGEAVTVVGMVAGTEGRLGRLSSVVGVLVEIAWVRVECAEEDGRLLCPQAVMTPAMTRRIMPHASNSLVHKGFTLRFCPFVPMPNAHVSTGP